MTATPLYEIRCPACRQSFGGDTALESAMLFFAHLKENKNADQAHRDEWAIGQQILRELPSAQKAGCA